MSDSKYLILATSFCARGMFVLILFFIFLWPSYSQAATIDRSDLQYAVFSVLVEIQSIQRHMIDTQQYHLLPTVRALLAQTVQLNTLIQTMPVSSSSEPATPLESERGCTSDGVSAPHGYSDSTVVIDSVNLQAQNGTFLCDEGEWVAQVCSNRSGDSCDPVVVSGRECSIPTLQFSVPDGMQLRSDSLAAVFGADGRGVLECRNGDLLLR